MKQQLRPTCFGRVEIYVIMFILILFFRRFSGVWFLSLAASLCSGCVWFGAFEAGGRGCGRGGGACSVPGPWLEAVSDVMQV